MAYESKIDIPTLKHNLARALNDPQLHLPDNAVVIDIETTGLNPVDDAHAWQLGVYPVRDGKPLYPAGENIYLQWPLDLLKKATFEIDRRRAVATNTASPRSSSERIKDGAYYMCEQKFLDEIYANGVPPREGLLAFKDVVETFVDKGYAVVGQNASRFDINFLQAECAYLNIPPIRFPCNNIVDVGILLKSSLLSKRMGYNETCMDFYHRVSSIKAKGVFYSLEKCNERWGLAAKHGLNMQEAHGAAFDCKLTWHCLQELVNEVLKDEMVTNAP